MPGRRNWPHKPSCASRTCYCADDDEGDPVCECGRPGWACNCEPPDEKAQDEVVW